jgi:ribosomal protein S18 acetylase RimI-like enzyme
VPSGDTTIRPYEEADRPAVVALWTEVFAGDPPWNDPDEVIRRKVGVQRELFLVCESGGRIVGTVLGGFDGFRGWAYHLAVAPERRRRGLGRGLMEELESRLRAAGCPKVNLQVRAGNEEALGFYHALGYATEERVSFGKLLGEPEGGEGRG